MIRGFRSGERVADRGLARTGAAWVATAFTITLGLGGCAGRGGAIPYDPPNLAVADANTRNLVPGSVPLGPRDQLKITVFRVPDLSGEYQVGGDGVLKMPLIEPVSVRDKTPVEAAALLESRYAERFLNNPSITIQVVKTSQDDITVEGGVRSAGIFPVLGSTTLLGAVALAKGVNPEDGNARRVGIFRKVDGQTMAAAFDLVAIRHGEMADPIVYPGDTVVVDTSSTRSIFRDILAALPVLAVFNPLDGSNGN